MLSAVSGADKDGTSHTVKSSWGASFGSKGSQYGNTYPGPGKPKQAVFSARLRQSPSNVGQDDQGSVDSAPMIIRKTTDWSVRYEDDQHT